MSYEVKVAVMSVVTYQVEAGSKEEAIMRAGNESYSKMVGKELGDEFLVDYGLSFEEAIDQDINVDYIRKGFNGDNNSDYIESIISVKEMANSGRR